MSDATAKTSLTFFEELAEQRWDDHRFYHQSRINQSLHLLSACCFLVTYALIPTYPVAAAFFGWFIAMWVRQLGHFFFEPKGFDKVNGVSFEHKEEIKVGFNLQRKVILLLAWLAVPALVALVPAVNDLVARWSNTDEVVHNTAVAWLGLAAAGLLGRTFYLCATRSLQTGLVWFTKILTDPIHDIKMYHRAPLALLRGELIDPMANVRGGH